MEKNTRFTKVEKAYQQRNIEEYYLASIDLMSSSVIRQLTGQGYTVEPGILDDLKSEIALQYWSILLDIKANRVQYSHNVDTQIYKQAYDYKDDITRTITETITETERVMANWYDVPQRLLWTILQSKIRRSLYKFFNTKSVNNCISLDLQMHDDIAVNGDDRIDSIMTRIEDTASRLAIDSVALIDSLQGSLSSTEYRYLVDWFTQGRQEKKNFRTVRKIREALKEIQDDTTSPDTFIHALRSEAERLYRLEHRISALLK